tara:strand:- start:8623 stop:12630 length:4008 start_codon:yes stop_codon:yes gene_type:complete
MRLNELFEEFVIEAPVTNSPAPGSSIKMSLADLYDMTGKTYPTKPGPNGNPITPPGFFDQKTFNVGGEGGISPELAQAHRQWDAGGRLPGLIANDDGEIRPYNENNTLVDMSWAFIAGGAELLNNWIKGAAVPIDDFINKFTLTGQVYKGVTGKNLSNLKTETLSGYDDRGDEFWGDKVVDYFNDKTDQAFKDNIALTQGAVNTWGQARDLLIGGTGFNIEGAGGIMINELPSEIVDLALMVTTGPLAGMAASGALNALEAGGAAAQSITDRINAAYDKGILQKQPPYLLAFDAAMMQLKEQQPGLSADERKEEAMDMARKHTISMSIQSAYYKVAVTGGVIDAIQNKILYKSNIGSGFLKTAVVKGLAGTGSEGVSGYLEQVFENTGIIDGAGNITTKTEGAFNAAYNEMLASQSGNVLATTADGVIRVKGATARFRQFIMGGSKDPKAILDIMAMDSNTLINNITKVDPETGVRKFAIAELIKKRVVTSDQLNDEQKKELKGGLFGIGGGKFTVTLENGETVTVTEDQLKENDDNVELISLLDDVEISADENTSTVNLNSEDEARRLAQLLGIEVKGKKVTSKTKINDVLSAIENVRKIDVRIEGRSTLEPPVWSDLNQRQQMQYWKEGQITFVNDPERGNQTWTRQQILFNSRRNNDSIPDDVANLEDNTTPRPNMNSDDNYYKREEIAENEKQIAFLEDGNTKNLDRRQKAWDNANPDVDPNNSENPRPTKQSLIDSGEYYVGLGTEYTLDRLKLRNQTLKTEVQLEARAWDQKYRETHLNDGSPKKGADILASNEVTKKKSELVNDNNKNKDEAITKALENDGVGEFDVSETPTVPVKDNQKARETFIAQAKIKISNGDMTAGELNTFLNNADNFYPDVSSEIMSKQARENYEKVDLQPEAKQEVIKDFKKPDSVVITTRPPEGTIVEKDGQAYVWLGVKDGVGGMWAKVKEDGSKGSTNHTNHNDLMTSWRDSQIKKDRPAELVQNEPSDEEVTVTTKKEPENKPNVQTTVTQPTGGDDTTGNTSGVTTNNIPPADDPATFNQTYDKLTTPQDNKDVEVKKQDDPDPVNVQTTVQQPTGNDTSTSTSGVNVTPTKDPEIPKNVQKIISDPENNQDLLPNVQKVTEPTANKPITFFPQSKLTKDQKDAIAGRGEYAPGQTSATDTPDAGVDVKDTDPNKAGIQTAQDQEGGVAQGMDQADQAQDNDPNAEVNPTNTTAQDNNPNQATDTAQANQDAADAAMGTAAIVTPAVTKTSKLNVTTDKNKNRKNTGKTDKTGVMRKGPRFFGGDDNTDDDITNLMKFYPANYRDPLDLDKYKGAIGRSRGLTGQK